MLLRRSDIPAILENRLGDEVCRRPTPQSVPRTRAIQPSLEVLMVQLWECGIDLQIATRPWSSIDVTLFTEERKAIRRQFPNPSENFKTGAIADWVLQTARQHFPHHAYRLTGVAI